MHSITATASDVAGNVSVASTTRTVTIQSAIAAPSTPDLVTASDSGASKTDNITNVKTPTFTGTAQAGSTITLYDGTTVLGTAKAGAVGNWSIVSSTLADGTHNITATASNAAGLVSAASAALVVTTDTLAPVAPSTPALTAASDSGISNIDDLTAVVRPAFAGTAEGGSTVTLLDGTTTIGTAVAGSDGTWSVTSTRNLANGVHSISAKATDLAGNVSSASTALASHHRHHETRATPRADFNDGDRQRRIQHGWHHQHRRPNPHGHCGGQQHGHGVRWHDGSRQDHRIVHRRVEPGGADAR